MATKKKPSAAQLAARKKFVAAVKAGKFRKKKKATKKKAVKRKPAKKKIVKKAPKKTISGFENARLNAIKSWTEKKNGKYAWWEKETYSKEYCQKQIDYFKALKR